jgi:large subunit ribosomal protein L29
VPLRSPLRPRLKYSPDTVMKIKEIRAKSVEELAVARRSMKQEMLNLRIQQKSGQLENPARINILRRSVARIETIINELAAKKAAAAK